MGALILKWLIHQNTVYQGCNFFLYSEILFLLLFQIMLPVKVLQHKFVSTYTLSFQRPSLNILNIMHSPTKELPHSQTDCT